MNERDQQELTEKLHIIADGASNESYIVYRVRQIVEHAIKEAEERAYASGWNDACKELEPIKPVKRKTYGFRDV